MSSLCTCSVRLLLAAISFIITVPACVADDDDLPDAADASFVGGDGKVDAFGIADPSYEASAILQVVNHASSQRLRDDIGIGMALVNRIVAARPLTSLVALDAVPYTGPVFFDRLLRHVRDRQLVGRCGDGVAQASYGGPEECDIASTEVGCGPTCRYESAPGCGDGVIDSTEACDDGNLAPLDGCSSSCRWELLDADSANPTPTFKHFIATSRPAWGPYASTTPVSLTIRFDLAQATKFGLDVAAFNSLSWGDAPGDLQAFKVELARHKGVETYPRLSNYTPLITSVRTNGRGYIANPHLDPAASVSLLTPAGSSWDTTIDLPVGETIVTITVSDWQYGNDGWAGMSALLVPLTTSGGTCGDGVKTASERCDDGNRTSGDGCNETCSVVETYNEKASSTNMRASGAENTGLYRIISGAFVRPWNDVDVDHYKITVTQPTTVSLVHTIFDGHPEVGCSNFDGLLERVATDDTVLQTSPDAADGCARLTLSAGTHILRVSEVTRGTYDQPYLLQMQ